MATNSKTKSKKSPSPLPTLRERSYETLRTMILNGELRPGSLLSEADLADRLAVSRTPVREALQMLAREGMVEVLPKRGTLVVQPSPAEVRESFEYREAIETAIARLTASRRTTEQLTAMRSALEASLAHDEDLEHASAFHESVARAAGNRYLQDAWATVGWRIDLVSNQASELTLDPMPDDASHEALYRAIEAQDAEEAEAVMRRHLGFQRDQLIADLL